MNGLRSIRCTLVVGWSMVTFAGAGFGGTALLPSHAATPATAQEIQMGDSARPLASKGGHVVLLTDSVALQAGSAQRVELRFRVDSGLHINSHKPADEFMVPTTLKLDPDPRLNVSDLEFPAGSPFRLKIGAGVLLDVYQGEFRVALRLNSPKPGEGTLTGTLRYQACDNAACFPPRSLPVRIAVTAR